jgi:hypothetical protein
MQAQADEVREIPRTPPFQVCLLVFVLASLLVLPFVLSLGMTKNLSHDEHQHVAAGALIAREGLLPYRDFPHFHTPYLAFAYAALFRMSDHLVMAARLLSVGCATALLGMLGAIAYSLFWARGRGFATLACAGTVLLGLTTTLFSQTAGHAWNHEPSLFLVVLAFLAHVAGLRAARSGWFVVSGLLLGLAIGTRLTCAPLVAPFGLALLLYPTAGWRWGRVLGFSGGLLLGLAGLFYFFAIVPEQTYFGNFDFAKVNITYRLASGEPRTMTLLTKLRFFFKVIVRLDAGLFLAGLLPLLAVFLALRGTAQRLRFELRFLLLLLPFLFLGSFVPSPLFDQYFLPLVPFLLLIGLYALASIPPESPWFRRTWAVGAAAVLLSLGMGWHGYRDLPDVFVLRKWDVLNMHARAQQLRSSIPRGRILTLAPIYPLEAGLSIYPAFSTGSVSWRVSPFVEPAKAARLGMISQASLEQALHDAPPQGVLLGVENIGEDLLSQYAHRHGYTPVPVPLDEGSKLWVEQRK